MKKNYYLASLLFFACLCFAFGQSVFTNPISGFRPNNDNPYINGQIVDANITATGIGRGTGINPKNTNDRYNASGWNTVAIDLTAYFEFTITPNAGFEIDFVSFEYTGQSSLTGPTDIVFRSSEDGFTTNIGTPIITGATINLSGLDYQNITTAITFRVYAWNASGGTGTFSINDFTFNGIVSTDGCQNTTTWNGTTWDNGIPDTNTEAILNGTYDTTANDNLIACNLTVNATLSIQNGGYIIIENDIIANANINVATEGSVIQIDNLATVSGTGVIEVTKTTAPMNNWYEYTYWSSPTSNTTIDNGITEGTLNRRFRFEGQNFLDEYAESNNDDTQILGQDDIDDNGDDWILVNGTDTMTPGYGYASTHREDLFFGPPMSSPPYQFDYTFTGLFNNGVITVPVYRNDTETNDTNWNFIGNPYPSAINVDTFFNENVNVLNVNGLLDGTVYLWSQNTQPSDTTNGNALLNFVQSDYATINGIGETQGGDDTNGDGMVDINDKPSRFIPSGQGFFVSFSDTPISVTGNVIFNNSMRVTGNNNQFFRNSTTNTSSSNRVWVNLTSDNGVFNQILVGYINNATNGFDGTYFDAPRNLSTGANSILYSIIDNNDKKYAIQGRDLNSLNEDEIIPLGFYTSIDEPTIYTLSLALFEGEFLNNSAIYIKDNLLNTIINHKDSDYIFTSVVGEFNNRFEIVYRAGALSIDDNRVDKNDLSVIELINGNVQFKIGNSFTITDVEILDITGRQIYNLKGDSSTEIYDLSLLSKAAYIAKVTLSNGQVISKKAIKRQ